MLVKKKVSMGLIKFYGTRFYATLNSVEIPANRNSAMLKFQKCHFYWANICNGKTDIFWSCSTPLVTKANVFFLSFRQTASNICFICESLLWGFQFDHYLDRATQYIPVLVDWLHSATCDAFLSHRCRKRKKKLHPPKCHTSFHKASPTINACWRRDKVPRGDLIWTGAGNTDAHPPDFVKFWSHPLNATDAGLDL